MRLFLLFISLNGFLLLPSVSVAGLTDGVNALQTKNFKRALVELLPLAKQGNAEAQYHIGCMYMEGHELPVSETEAAKWFRKAGDQGNGAAQFYLGVLYYNGTGLPQNSAEAMQWWTKAAEQGYVSAQFFLGLAYSHDPSQPTTALRTIPRNDPEAAKWYRKAAEQGDGRAMGNLGVMYFRGQGVSIDYSQSAMWLKKAADNWNEEAKNNLVILGTVVLKPGFETHCGMVIEVKEPIVKIQTVSGEKWFRIDQVFPVKTERCQL